MPHEKKGESSTLNQEITDWLKVGPQPSPALYRHLEELGYSNSAARTAVSRLVSARRVSKFILNLGHGTSILTLGKPNADAALLRQLYANRFYGRSALLNLIDCLRTSHPNVARSDVAAIAALEIGAASLPEPDWSEVDALLSGLMELGVLKPDQQDGSDATWTFNKQLFAEAKLPVGLINTSPALVAMRRRVKFTVAAAMGDWLHKNSFVSPGGTKVAKASRPANYLSLPYDAIGFSFLGGIASRGKEGPQPRPVIGDCLVEECNLAYAKSFAMRVDQSAAKGRKQPLSFIVARTFEHGAFGFLRQHGIATWTQSQLLGSRTAEAIARILSIAEGLILQQQIDPTAFAEMFAGLDNYSGLLGNLKGKLFELMIGYFFQRRANNTRLGWEIEDQDDDARRSYDVDVFAVRNTEAWVVECKGNKASALVPDEEVTRHFKERVPLARTYAFGDKLQTIKSVTGIVVTSATFDPTTIEKMDRQAYGARTDTRFELWNRERLTQELSNDGLHQLAAIIDRYYV